VPFQKPADVTLYLRPVPECARLGSFFKRGEFAFKTGCEAVEYGVLLFLASLGATEDKGFLCPFR